MFYNRINGCLTAAKRCVIFIILKSAGSEQKRCVPLMTFKTLYGLQ